MVSKKNAFFGSQAAEMFGAGGRALEEYRKDTFEHNVTLKAMQLLGYDRVMIKHLADMDEGMLKWENFVSSCAPLPFKLKIASLPRNKEDVSWQSLLLDLKRSPLYHLWRKHYNNLYDFVVTNAMGFAASGGFLIGVNRWAPQRPPGGSTVVFGTAVVDSKQPGRVGLDCCILGSLSNVFTYLIEIGVLQRYDQQAHNI